MVSPSEVGDDSRMRVTFRHIDHITKLNAITTILPGIGVVLDLQHPPLDIVDMMGEKTLNIVAINGLSTVETKFMAYRRYSAQVAKTHPTYWWAVPKSP